MCGFRQSYFVRVPLKLTRLLKSNSADILWWAHAAPAATHMPAATSTEIREFIRGILLVTSIRWGVQIRSPKDTQSFQPRQAPPPSPEFGSTEFRVSRKLQTFPFPRVPGTVSAMNSTIASMFVLAVAL